MQIDSVAINLPDLDHSVSNRTSLGIEQLASEMRDLSNRRRNAVVDDDQIVVRIEREPVRIKRPFRLPWSQRKRFGKCASHVPERWPNNRRRRYAESFDK